MSTRELKHVAIILDGNRTWAAANGLPRMVGHTRGAQNIKDIVEVALNERIPYLTLYTLSTENLKNRSEDELKHLFSLFEKLVDYVDLFQKNDVKFNAIGDLGKMPANIQKSLTDLKELTKNNKALTLTTAINYGGRDEIIRAIKKLPQDPQALHNITEESFAEYLDTNGLPDVDLLIRTGGFQRLSNFLPWQSTYSELYFTETKWPAFKEKDLKAAIEWFFEQEMKKGK